MTPVDWQAEIERRTEAATAAATILGRRVIIVDLTDAPPEALTPPRAPTELSEQARKLEQMAKKAAALADMLAGKGDEAGAEQQAERAARLDREARELRTKARTA